VTHPISETNLALLIREASTTAAVTVRRYRLQPHDWGDLRQELLVRSLPRARSFDPTRGSFGAFAGRIMRRQASLLAKRVRRARAAFALMSLDDPLPRTDGGTVGSAIAEADGYGAWLGQPTDAIAALDRRLDLRRALASLGRSDLALCVALTESTPGELSRAGRGARTSLYLRVREIRLRLLAAGIDARG